MQRSHTLIGGTVIVLVFLPALYAIWFRVRVPGREVVAEPATPDGLAPATPH